MSRGSVGLLGAALYAHFRVASACAEHNRQYITAIKQKPETIPRFTRGKVFAEQGLRCKASHKDRVLPPLDGPGGVALSRRTDTDSRASQPRGVLRTAAGGRDPATARDRESNSATCNSPPLLVRPAQAQCHAYPVAVVWLKGDSVPPQAERG